MPNQPSDKKASPNGKPSSFTFIEETADGLYLRIRVQPRSSKNEVCGVQGNALKIKLTAPPVEGEANKRLIEFLSGFLDIKKSALAIDSGDKSKNKRVKVEGLTKTELEKALSTAVQLAS